MPERGPRGKDFILRAKKKLTLQELIRELGEAHAGRRERVRELEAGETAATGVSDFNGRRGTPGPPEKRQQREKKKKGMF